MKKVLLGLATVLVVAGALAYWGGSFATNMVHDELVAQKITFPAKDKLEKDNPALVKYAGQQVDNGEKAKAYSDYINGHLAKVAGGKTYSEVSSEYQKNTSDQKLAGQRQSLFMGETLRGLLLNAWGWSVIGTIASYASYILFFLALVAVLVSLGYRAPSKKKSGRK